MIYTSYFANMKKLPKNIVPISICAKAPNWYNGLQYKKFAPKYDFFMKWKETHDNDYYVECFNKQVLSNLSVKSVVQELYDIVNSSYTNKGILHEDILCLDIALICYEKPSDFCHRHLVADWFNKNGIKCVEWNGEK